MKTINQNEWREFIDRAGIVVPAPASAFGGGLRYKEEAQRTLVIHFTDDDIPIRLSKTLKTLLTVQDGWYLFPRTGAMPVPLYEGEDIPKLQHQLVQEFGNMAFEDNDLYVFGASGDVYLSYDHLFMDEGLNIYLQNIELANSLLVLLNKLGSKVEQFPENTQ